MLLNAFFVSALLAVSGSQDRVPSASVVHTPLAKLRSVGEQGWLGVSLSGAQDGVSIASVVAGSPAAKGGLEAGDVIATIDGEAVGDVNDLVSRVRAHQPGHALAVGVRRSLHIEVGAASNEGDEGDEANRRPRMGVELNEEGGRVQIATVAAGSGAERGGVHAGDHVVSFDGEAVESIEQLIERVRATEIGASIQLGVIRPLRVKLGKAPRQAFVTPEGFMAPEADTEPAPPTPSMPRLAPLARIPRDAQAQSEVRDALRDLREELQSLRKELADLRRDLRELRAQR